MFTLPFIQLNQLAQQTPLQNTNTPMWLIIVLAVLGSSALAASINVVFARTKTKSEGDKLDADAAEALSRTAAGLVKEIQEHYKRSEATLLVQIDAQSRKIDELSLQVAKIPELQASVLELTKGIELLTLQLLEHDINPAYMFSSPPQPPTSQV